jgi:hypothetical protein
MPYPYGYRGPKYLPATERKSEKVRIFRPFRNPENMKNQWTLTREEAVLLRNELTTVLNQTT